MTANFITTKSYLVVKFRDLSTGNPTNYLWDFGDGITSTERSPTHTYTESGFYVVTLKVSDGQLEDVVAISIGVSQYAKTQLSDSIYVLIDTYVPEEFKDYLSERDRRVYIEKWQLYLYPLVCHCIQTEDYNDESRYEALENQLIMELAAWEHLLVVLQGLLKAASKTVESSEEESSEDGDGKGRVKQIETGPTSVQFYEGISGAAAASLAKVVTGALQPGGFIDTLKESLCMLAFRLGIFLPICPSAKGAFVKVPRKVNPRRPGPLGGPNPTSPLRRRR